MKVLIGVAKHQLISSGLPLPSDICHILIHIALSPSSFWSTNTRASDHGTFCCSLDAWRTWRDVLFLRSLFLGTTNLLSNHNIPFPFWRKHLYFSIFWLKVLFNDLHSLFTKLGHNYLVLQGWLNGNVRQSTRRNHVNLQFSQLIT